MSKAIALLNENEEVSAKNLQNKRKEFGQNVPDSARDKELKATIESALHDHHSASKLYEIKRWLKNKVGKFNDALSAIDQITGSTAEHVSMECDAPGIATEGSDFSQRIPAGSELFRQGSRPREVYSLEKGLVKLVHQEAQGKEIIAAIRYPGWLLAASAVILDEPLPVTAVAITRCSLTRMGAEEFRSLIKNDTDLSWKLHAMMAREVHNQMVRLTGIECLSARQRLEELIWQLISATESIPDDKPVRFQFPVKHSEIAQILAVSPQYLSWLIGRLEKEKMIQRDKGWLIVPRPEKLWHREELKESSYSFGSLFELIH